LRAGFALKTVGSFVNGIDALARLRGGFLYDDELGESGHQERTGLLEFLVANFGHRLDDALDVLACDLVWVPLDDSLNEFRLRHSVSHLYPLSLRDRSRRGTKPPLSGADNELLVFTTG
jgi:hypothetical protein